LSTRDEGKTEYAAPLRLSHPAGSICQWGRSLPDKFFDWSSRLVRAQSAKDRQHTAPPGLREHSSGRYRYTTGHSRGSFSHRARWTETRFRLLTVGVGKVQSSARVKPERRGRLMPGIPSTLCGQRLGDRCPEAAAESCANLTAVLDSRLPPKAIRKGLPNSAGLPAHARAPR